MFFSSEVLGQLLVNSLISGSIYALIAFGFTLSYGTMNFFNMGYGAHIVLAAYAFYSFYKLLNLNIFLSAILAFLILMPIMIAIDRISYYPMRKKEFPGWSIIVVSIAVNLIVESIISIVYGNYQQFILGGATNLKKLTFAGINITISQVAIIAIAVAIMVSATLFLKKTRIGLLIRGIANNKQMAYVVGIDVEKIYVVIIAVSSFLSTAAAILMSLEYDIRPRMGASALAKAITASVIGGAGNIRGTLIAGYVFGLIENVVSYFIGAGWRDAIALPIVVILLLVMPSRFGIVKADYE